MSYWSLRSHIQIKLFIKNKIIKIKLTATANFIIWIFVHCFRTSKFMYHQSYINGKKILMSENPGFNLKLKLIIWRTYNKSLQFPYSIMNMSHSVAKLLTWASTENLDWFLFLQNSMSRLTKNKPLHNRLY